MMQFTFGDILSWQALLPAIVTGFGNALAIHGLWESGQRKLNTLRGYTILTIILAVGLGYVGADQHRTGRDQQVTQAQEREREIGFETRVDKKLDIVRNVLGTPPGVSGDQVLDQVIARFNQPEVISPPQEKKLSELFSGFKSEIPNPINLTSLPGVSNYNGFLIPMTRAFGRVGTQINTRNESPTDVAERGSEFAMPDPEHPPEFAVKLRDAFDLVGITDIRFVKMPAEMGVLDFAIFDAGP